MIKPQRYILESIRKITQSTSDIIYVDKEHCSFLLCNTQITSSFKKHAPNINALLKALEKDGYVSLSFAHPEELYLQLTDAAQYYPQYCLETFKEFIFKSIFTPIVVSIITTIITLGITRLL